MTQPTIFQKRCNVCQNLKPWDEFYSHKTAKDGLHPSCKECVRRRSDRWRYKAIADGRYRLTKTRYRTSENGKASTRRYEMKETTKAKRRETGRAWYIENRERMGITPRRPWTKERRKAQVRNSLLKAKYGITQDDYNVLYVTQEGLCAICGNPPRGKNNQSLLAVDHDHSTGAVRGLLCHNCNAGMGLLKEDPQLLERARIYLLEHAGKSDHTNATFPFNR